MRSFAETSGFNCSAAGKALVAFAAAACLSACAGNRVTDLAASPAPEAQLEDLLGVWDVALFFDPNQPPSATVMEITGIQDGAVAGTFYGSAFTTGRAVLHRGDVVFSVITADGTGDYAHSGRLDSDGRIEGQTLSTGRSFVMAWEAARRVDAK